MTDIDTLVRAGYLKTQDELSDLVALVREAQGLVNEVLTKVLLSDYSEEDKAGSSVFVESSHNAMGYLSAMNTQLCRWVLVAARDAEYCGEPPQE